MGAASLHLYLRDRQQMFASIVSAAVLLLLALLAFAAILDAMTADPFLGDGRLMAPFRWGPLEPPGLS
jgi:hypothetical protein